MGIMTRMLRRSMEMQASQVLQTGNIRLTDEKGNETFDLGLTPNASHFPTVTTPWSDVDNASPLDDIEALTDVIRNDGLVDITTLVFGRLAWLNFIKNEWVRENLKKDVLNMGEMNPQIVNKGGKRMGYIDYGSYRFILYTYNARYNPFGDKVNKYKFVDDNKVILLPDVSDLDFRRLFGGIPSVRMDSTFDTLFSADSKIPIGGEYDIRPRVWWSDDNETCMGELKTRPLMLPVSFQRYGCLTVA
jgi:hypothetical protein